MVEATSASSGPGVSEVVELADGDGPLGVAVVDAVGEELETPGDTSGDWLGAATPSASRAVDD